MKKTSSFLFVLLLVVAHAAQAQTPVSTAFAFERFMITAKGGGWTTGGNAAGQSVAMGPSALTKAFSEASTATVTPLTGGGATVGLSMGSSAAGSVLATSQAVLTGAAIVATAKAILGGPVGIGMTALMLAPALVDWFTTDTTRPGVPETWSSDKPFEKLATQACTVQSPCYDYYTSDFPNYFSTAPDACNHLIPTKLPGGVGTGSVIGTAPNDLMCKLYKQDGTFWVQMGLYPHVKPLAAEQWERASIDDIRAKMETEPVQKTIIDAILQTMIDRPDLKVKGVPLSSPSNVAVVPLSIPDAAVVTVTKADGKTTTKTDQKITTLSPSVGVDADGKQVQTVTATTKVQSTTKVVDDATGATISESTTATDTPTAKPAPLDLITCGLPGTPPCKIDEQGTPIFDKSTVQLDKTKLDADSQAQRTTIQGNADKGMFASWSALFTLPALRACEPVALPTYVGVNLGSYDVCPGAEWVRGLMAWVWAVAGFVFVFKTVEGVI